MTDNKPLCPCCFKAYTSSILDVPADTTTESFDFSSICGSCAPSEVEKALAKKAESSTDIPPIVWLLTPPEIEEKTAQILRDTEANLDSIAAVPLEEVTFDNTIAKLMTPPNYKTNPQVASVKFLQHCSTDPAIRDAAGKAGKDLSRSRVVGRMRKDVYERVKAFANSAACNELDDYKKHFVKAALQDFERAGLALSEEDGAEFQRLLEEDTLVCNEYKTNLASDNTKLFFTPEQLKGCTEDFIKERLNKDQEGKCTITLKYPDIIPIGQTCEVAETRRAVTEAREGSKAYKNNLELVARGIQIRKRIAALLGYPSWAEYICNKRMSGSYQAVDDFLTNLQRKLESAGKDDYALLLQLKEEHCKDEDRMEFDGVLNAWDTSFYGNKLLKTEYGVDSEKIREYFPLDHVVETTLAIYQELLGLKFDELPQGIYWSWHKEVRCFQVKDSESANSIGHFYLDLHPRHGKYGHAAIFHLVKRNINQGAVDCMLCNLPASTNDKPSLLQHQNVVTFFHEFGHIMHALCSEGIGNMTRLAKCPRDFVEAPSQMLENWCWKKAVLERLSKHYQTGAPLPDAMLQSMIRAKHVNVAFGSLRQIYLSRLDMEIHGISPPTTVEELQDLVDKLRLSITLIQNPPGNNMLRTFGHLMNQYSASYYGYMWAEVLSADMFAARFETDGVMNTKPGMDYRKMVLAPGGTHNIRDHLTKFLSREPNNEAFLKSRGIL